MISQHPPSARARAAADLATADSLAAAFFAADMLGLTFLRMNNSRSLTKNENDFACNIGPPLFPNT